LETNFLKLKGKKKNFNAKDFPPSLTSLKPRGNVPPAVTLRNYIARGMYVFGMIRKINTDGHGLCALLRRR
jgi:hypothetical protein